MELITKILAEFLPSMVLELPMIVNGFAESIMIPFTKESSSPATNSKSRGNVKLVAPLSIAWSIKYFKSVKEFPSPIAVSAFAPKLFLSFEFLLLPELISVISSIFSSMYSSLIESLISI